MNNSIEKVIEMEALILSHYFGLNDDKKNRSVQISKFSFYLCGGETVSYIIDNLI